MWCFIAAVVFGVLINWFADATGLLSPYAGFLGLFLGPGVCVFLAENWEKVSSFASKVAKRLKAVVLPRNQFTECLSEKEKVGGYLDFVDFGGE